MKKTLVVSLVLTLVMFSFVPISQALTASKTFTVSASVPSATGIGINASKVDSTSNAFTPVAGTALSFNPLIFNAANGIYLPDHYFAIDVAATGGAGVPSTTVTYTEGANPNSPNHGLGWKSTATFVKVVGTTETQLATHGPKKLLKSVSGESITAAEVNGGYLRIYLGVVTGDATTPATGEVFSNTDMPGTYDGALLVSATIP